MIYRIVHAIVAFTFRVCFRLKVIGAEHLPQQGGFLVASNHVSYLDPVIVGVVAKHKVGYMARESLFRNFFFGWLIRSLGAFPLKRNTADFRAIREAIRRLKNGWPVLIFPEGTRKSENKPKEANAGVGFLAVRGGVPVVPMYIVGTDKALPVNRKWVRFTPITVHIGPARVYTADQPHEQIADDIMGSIQALAGPVR